MISLLMIHLHIHIDYSKKSKIQFLHFNRGHDYVENLS